MPAVATPAIILSAVRYGDSSKVVKLATEDHGVQSAIAKGAMRPKSRFGASLQVLSDGVAHLIMAPHRELQLLTAFDLSHVRVGLSAGVNRYAAAGAVAELMLRFAPAAGHAESFHVLREALDALEQADEAILEALALRALWSVIGVLGFEPSMAACARDGAGLPEGALAFSTGDGGALCEACARSHDAARLQPRDRADLEALVDPNLALPALDDRRAAAHRRLVLRYIQHHLGEGATLPALDFWFRRPWVAA